MKYLEQKEVAGQGHTFYKFCMSAEEMAALKQTISWVVDQTPQTFETQSYRARMNAIKNELTRTLKMEDIKVPRSTPVTFKK